MTAGERTGETVADKQPLSLSVGGCQMLDASGRTETGMKLTWNKCFHGDAVKRSVAGLMLFLWLFTVAMAVCPELHELIHKDADEHDHHCAVTMLLQGNVDATTVEVPVVLSTVLVEITPRIEFLVFSPAIGNLPPGRAPPVSPAAS